MTVPRSLQRLLRRLSVGRSTVFLNELLPNNQLLFLLGCLIGEKQERKEGVDILRGIRLSRKDVSTHVSVRIAQRHELAGSSSSPSSSATVVHEKDGLLQCTSVPILEKMETVLQLPQGSSGQLEAYRTPHPNLLLKPTLFFLVVPCSAFKSHDTCENLDHYASANIEDVLQQHLVLLKKTLYWRETPSFSDDKENMRREIPEVIFEGIWGCTLTQVRQAAEIAAAHACRVFLLGNSRHRLLSSEGPTLREMGNWCPSAFRGFHIDVHATEQAETSSHSSALQLLEEAQRGFVAKREATHFDTRNSSHITKKSKKHRNSMRHLNENSTRVEHAVSFAVVEVIVDPKRDAFVPWACVRDNSLTARLFEALYDRRHFCTADAVLHASERVVLPFLIGAFSIPFGSHASEVLTPSHPAWKLMRWSELHTALRWRYFESAFGALSQVLREENVAAVGGGLDPFILPLHDTFITRVLLPRMRAYYHKRHPCNSNGTPSATVLRASASRGRTRVDTPPLQVTTGTVDILDFFNSLVMEPQGGCEDVDGMGEDKGIDKKKKKKSQFIEMSDTKGGTSITKTDNDALGDVCFALEDLPGLVKYLLYFGQYFQVSNDAVNVSFALEENYVI